MDKEYVIISKTDIQKRIEELEKEVEFYNKVGALSFNPNKVKAETELSFNKEILYQSTPLIPVLEQAFDEGSSYLDTTLPVECKQDYIANLKLDI